MKPFLPLLASAIVALSFVTRPAAAASAWYFAFDLSDTHDQTPGDGVCQDAAGNCTLRAALEETEAQPGVEATVFLLAGTYELTLGQLVVKQAESVTILGWDTASTIIRNPTGRILSIQEPFPNAGHWDGVEVELRLLTMRDAVVNLFPGGAIQAGAGTALSAYHVHFLNNHAGAGAGIATQGYVNLADCLFEENRTSHNFGGGIASNGGALFLSADGFGRMTRSSMVGNTATRGGAIAGGGEFQIYNSTLAENKSFAQGGAIYRQPNPPGQPWANWVVSFSTIVDNVSSTVWKPSTDPHGGGGVYAEGPIRFGSTILARNTSANHSINGNDESDCKTVGAGAVQSHGRNVVGALDADCSWTLAEPTYTDKTGVPAVLSGGNGPLDPWLGNLRRVTRPFKLSDYYEYPVANTMSPPYDWGSTDALHVYFRCFKHGDPVFTPLFGEFLSVDISGTPRYTGDDTVVCHAGSSEGFFIP